MTRRLLVSIGLLALVAVGLIRFGDTSVNAAKAPTYVGEVTIAPTTGDLVSGDVPDTNVPPFTYTYTDYQVSGRAIDYCVNGVIGTDGSAFFRLDRKQGFNDNLDLWCNQRQNPYTNEPAVARKYTLILGDQTAYSQLSLGDSPCTLVSPVPPLAATLQPHIFASGPVFKKGATKTPVDFDFTPNGIAYRVTTDQDATILPYSPNSNSRTVTYTGTAHLRYTGGATIGDKFRLPFTMIFTRIAL